MDDGGTPGGRCLMFGQRRHSLAAAMPRAQRNKPQGSFSSCSNDILSGVWGPYSLNSLSDAARVRMLMPMLQNVPILWREWDFVLSYGVVGSLIKGNQTCYSIDLEAIICFKLTLKKNLDRCSYLDGWMTTWSSDLSFISTPNHYPSHSSILLIAYIG